MHSADIRKTVSSNLTPSTMETNFDIIFNRAVSEKMAQILNDLGCINIQIDEHSYLPKLYYFYKGTKFQLYICSGNCTVRIKPMDSLYHHTWDTRKINTLEARMKKILRDGYVRIPS
jgi:hypothetical protein